MNPLQSRLAALRRRLRLVALIRGVNLLCILILGSFILSGVLDWNLHLPAVIRAFLLVGIMGSVAAVLYRLLILPLSSHVDDLSLALRVEEQYPVLNDSLASTVQFLGVPKESPAAGSESLRNEAISRALRLAQGCDFNRVVNMRGLPLTSAFAAVVLVSAIGLTLTFPSVVRPAVLRLAHPFGEWQWETETQLTNLDYRKRIATGQPFQIKGDVTGVIPGNATIEFQGLIRSEVPRDYPIKVDDTGTKGTFTAKLDMTGQERDFRFRIKANDARSPRREGLWHTVKVARPPNLVAVDGEPPPYIELYVPAYTELPSPQKMPPGTWQVEAIEGTVFHLYAATDRPIATAWVRHNPADPRQMFAAHLAMIGHANPLATLSVAVGTKAAYARMPAQLDADGKHITAIFRPWLSGNYVLHIEDEEELPNKYHLTLNLVPDPAPVVRLKQPADNLDLLPDAEITLQITTEDEVFALRNVYLEYFRKDSTGRLLDDQPQRLPLYDYDRAGHVARLMAALSGMPLPVAPSGKQPRPKFLNVEHRWSLKGLVKKGDILVIQACANDFNDVVAFNIPGKSHQIELRIVGKTQLESSLDKKQAKIHENLLRLRAWQEEALKKVIEVEQNWKNTGKLTDQDMKRLMEAQQLQKQIQARIGETKNDGLRKELGRLEEMLKDNQIDSSGAKDRIDVMKKELERIASEHLPQIPPRLNDALQQMNSSEEKQSSEKKAEADLAKAREHQEKVQNALDDLLKHLSRWADLQEIKGETRAVLKEQKELKADAVKLNKKYDPQDGKWKADLQRVAELQRRLGERTQRLLLKMERVAKEKKKSDPKLAKMLKKAARIGKDGMVAEEIKDTKNRLEMALPDRMQDVSNNLRKTMVHKAIGQQDNSIKTLNKIVEALQESRTDELERLVKKQKQAKNELKDLVERLQKLKKKVQDANKIADPEKRRQALKKLRDEQKKLQEEVAKKARDMAPLRASGAGEEMRQAAEELDKALKRLEDGENPEENQQAALDRLQQAQEKLKEAEKRTQDELEREQLARIADRLKGLKGRQDAAIGESERLHTKILRGGPQQAGLRASFDTHRKSQNHLAEEANRLAKKLEGAKVYALVLNKVGEDMTKAAKSIHDRLKATVFHEFPFGKAALAEEKDAQQKIIKHQEHARDRLQRLLSALQDEIKKKKQQAQQKQQGEDGKGEQKGGNGGGQPQGGVQAQDGIPAVAQLKVLRGEQADINQRTKTFAKDHPAMDNLPQQAQEELNSIHADQEAIYLLFQELMATTNKGEKQ